MIAQNDKEALVEVELSHCQERILVGEFYVIKFPVFPKIVTVPDFNIGESSLMVVLKRMNEDMLVVGKVIRPAIVTPMAIAKQYELGGVVKGYSLGGIVYLCEAIF